MSRRQSASASSSKTDSGSGSLLLYGIHAVESVLEHQARHVSELYLSTTIAEQAGQRLQQLAEAQAIPARRVDRDWFEENLSDLPHQKVAASYRQPAARTETELLKWLSDKPAPHLILALDGVQDPQNFGACVRVAEALGALAVLHPKANSASLGAATHKAAAGALAILPVVEVSNLARALQNLKQAGCWIYGAAGESAVAIDKIDFAESSVVVMGAEGRGLRDKTRKNCDQLFAIPMSGQTNSLNVSVATGIALYSALHKPSDPTP